MAKSKAQRKKLQAFTAPKNARTKAIVAQNTKNSPLLKLSEEVRLMIWGYVIGHQTVHIYETHYLPAHNGHIWLSLGPPFLVHAVCKAPISEQEGHQLCQSEDYERDAPSLPPGCDLRLSSNRHHDCTYRSGCKLLPLEVLRVSRQVYIEVNDIMWTTTTWSFQSQYVLERFLYGYKDRNFPAIGEIFPGRNPLQKRLLKKMHLQIDYFRPGGSWSADKTVLSRWPPLESFYIDIESGDERCVRGNFKLPHLNDVKVTFHRNKGHNTTGLAELPWSERLSIAEQIRKAITEVQATAERETQETKADLPEKKQLDLAFAEFQKRRKSEESENVVGGDVDHPVHIED